MGGIGEHTLEVWQLVNVAGEGQLRFAVSNVLRIQIADPSLIERKWGTPVKGIAADISLEKDMYQVGEDVPLHLAIENFDAEEMVYGDDPLWDPCGVIRIEVQDITGHTLAASERAPNWTLCTGHGFGPRPYAKGKVIPMERTLGGEGWLPNHVGTFIVVVTWAPFSWPNRRDTDMFPPAELRAMRRHAPRQSFTSLAGTSQNSKKRHRQSRREIVKFCADRNADYFLGRRVRLARVQESADVEQRIQDDDPVLLDHYCARQTSGHGPSKLRVNMRAPTREKKRCD
jgi:hypothetical protein